MTNKKKSSLLDSKILWAVVSLLASLLLWVYVTGTQQEIITVSLDNVEVIFTGETTLQDARNYIVTNIDTQTVSVTISGTRINIGRLSEADVTAVVDVSKITATGNYTRPYALTYPESVDADAVSVVSGEPEFVSFLVTRMSSKSVPVECRFAGQAAEGYIANEIEYEPQFVLISGPESELAAIDHVYAEMAGEDLTRTRTAEVPFVLMDKDDNVLEIEGLEYDYETISVTVPISMKKEIALEVTLIYGAGATAENTIVSVEPATITIAGDPTVVEGINRLSITTIDLSDIYLSFEDVFQITLPNDVTCVTGETEARVRVELQNLQTKLFTVENIDYTSLPDGYSAEVITRSILITVRGPQETLDAIRPENIRVVADLSEISALGDMSVPARVYVDGYTDAGAVGDYMLTVNISRG